MELTLLAWTVPDRTVEGLNGAAALPGKTPVTWRGRRLQEGLARLQERRDVEVSPVGVPPRRREGERCPVDATLPQRRAGSGTGLRRTIGVQTQRLFVRWIPARVAAPGRRIPGRRRSYVSET